MDIEQVIESIVDACARATAPGIVFVRYRRAADAAYKGLKAAGVHCAVVTGNTPRAERARIQEALCSGAVDWVVATDAWATGLDVPVLRSVVNAAGGCAPVSLKQRACRGTRLADGKQRYTLYDLALGDRASQQVRLQHYVRCGLVDGNVPARTERAHDVLLASLFKQRV